MSFVHQSAMIPLSKLRPSKSNVRKTGREAGIDQLAASINHDGLINPLTIAPEIGKNGEPTGHFEVIAGGRRFAALKLLAKRKAIRKAEPVPCITLEEASEAVSLAENIMQAPMHPADQYEAFAALRAGGMTAQDIAARYGLSARTVEQRFRLGAASPTLMTLYRDGEISLDQLMAFCLTDDHAVQERVWESLGWDKGVHTIRRLLTQGQAALTDRRARFVGLEAYEAAGGPITRDLFSQEEGQGYIADPALLEQLVTAKLAKIAEEVQAEGWKWVSVGIDHDHAATAGMRRVQPFMRELTDDEQARLDALQHELETLPDDHPEMEAEAVRLETEIEQLQGPPFYDPDHLTRGGACISLDYCGGVRIERGLIRPEDMPKDEEAEGEDQADRRYAAAQILEHSAQGEETEEDISDLPARLLCDLTAHRTAALRHGIATQPDVAYLAVVHAFAMQTFYWGDTRQTCLDLVLRNLSLAPMADDIDANEGQREVASQHAAWQAALPGDPADLWAYVVGQMPEQRAALLAHCAALTLDAVQRPGEGRYGKHRHADQLAEAVSLDMTAYWQPTEQAYFKRVTKQQIIDAVREGKGDVEAGRMEVECRKKADMAARAEHLLKDGGWLPQALRGPRNAVEAAEKAAAA